MSTMFGNSMGFQIHSDSAENAVARKSKREDVTKGPEQKRPALGIITNTNLPRRVQPFRHGKQIQHQSDNAQIDLPSCTSNSNAFVAPSKSSNLPFKIHVDEDPHDSQTTTSSEVQMVKPVVDHKLRLHPAVTQVSRADPISTALHCQNDLELASPIDSPMVVDSSVVRDDAPESRMQKVLNVPEYKEDIYRYLREAELRHRPKPSYLRKQPDITASMRTILVDWLVEVAEEYKLHRETLFLSVNYIDRFLSHMSVLRGKLQLVGAATTFLAAKYEEIYPPDVGEFVYITDDTYEKKQVLRMEHLVLKVLSFDVAAPTANVFAEKFVREAELPAQVESLTMYLAELTLLDAEVFLRYLPSVVAAAAVALACHSLGLEAWPESLQQATGYTLAELDACMTDMLQAMRDARAVLALSPEHRQGKQVAIPEKYAQAKFHEVSRLSPPAGLPSVPTMMVI